MTIFEALQKYQETVGPVKYEYVDDESRAHTVNSFNEVPKNSFLDRYSALECKVCMSGWNMPYTHGTFRRNYRIPIAISTVIGNPDTWSVDRYFDKIEKEAKNKNQKGYILLSHNFDNVVLSAEGGGERIYSLYDNDEEHAAYLQFRYAMMDNPRPYNHHMPFAYGIKIPTVWSPN